MNKAGFLTPIILVLAVSAVYAQKKKATPIKAGKVCEIRISESNADRLVEAIQLAKKQRDTVKASSVEARRIVYVNLKTGSKINDKTLKAVYDKAGIATDKIVCMLL